MLSLMAELNWAVKVNKFRDACDKSIKDLHSLRSIKFFDQIDVKHAKILDRIENRLIKVLKQTEDL